MRFTFALLAVLLAASTVAQQLPSADSAGTSTLVGTILSPDGKKLSGARMLAYHLTTEKTYSSEPTGGNGSYVIRGLPYGYLDLAVETAEGIYPADRVVNLAPSRKTAVIVQLRRAVPGIEPTARFADLSGTVVGMATAREKPRGKQFWRSAKGVAVLSSIGGAALLAIAAGSDSEDPASPN